MSDPDDLPLPFGPGGFDLSRMLAFLQAPGPIHRDLARQVARLLADGGTTAVAVDPSTVEGLAALARAAQLHVAEATGLDVALTAPPEVLGRADFAERLLDGLGTVLVALGGRLTAQLPVDPVDDEPPDPAGPLDPAQLLGSMLPALTPVLLGLQAGTMAGNLAQRMLGSYDLPLPLDAPPRVAFAAPNVDAFRSEWSLPPADFHFVLALHEVTHAAVRSVPWVPVRLLGLSQRFVDGYRVDPEAVEAQFGAVDLSDPSSLQGVLDDPERLLGALRSPAQDAVLVDLRTFTAVLAGYADHIVARIGAPLIPAVGQVQEATRRHRLVLGDAERFIERLLGMELTRDLLDRGRAFCDGVVERAGPEGLARLWEAEAMVPTASELDAPGLWLARIDLPA